MKTWIVCVALVGCGPTGSGPVNVEQPTSAAEACSRVGNPSLVLSTWHVCDPSGSGARCFVGTRPMDPVLECRAWTRDATAFCFEDVSAARAGEPLVQCPDGLSNCPPSWSCRDYASPVFGRTIRACFPPSCSSQTDAGRD